MAAEAGQRRAGRRDRDDRARHRLRPAGHQDARGPRRRPLRPQRREDLHHQWAARRPRRRRVQDRPGRGRAGRLADRGRDGHPGLPPRPRPRQGRAEGPGHRRAVLRRRPRAGRQPAGRRRGPGLHPADAAAAAGTADHRRHRGGRPGGGGRPHAGVHQGAHGVRPADLLLPEHQVHPRRGGDRSRGGPGVPRPVHRTPPQGRARRPGRGDGEAVDHRARQQGRRRLRAALRRLRLHDRVPDRARLGRRPYLPDLRRHQRNHEGNHLPLALKGCRS
ncbi:acyl-CoA dehydrogenase [Amycolatopsis vancoresmycina DSM 44592]|uniref:Acyl-CoA dehydrogenase n=1 Tax=Amycolatopsis vancoresmycina DSM 44592 TaxID=1292037 RepID=R1FY72_9PSEU|nr:acyl-CoA dehydrogenase [Amycolatopsis vancoresmycina DSM 44592]